MLEKIKQSILKNGYAIIDLDCADEINRQRNELAIFTNELTNSSLPENLLENVHHCISEKELNDYRLKAISIINRDLAFKENLKKSIAPIFQFLLGPDLAIQKNINLVISIPGDATSQIPLHSDYWTGHSAFELNLWTPLTKTFKSQSMFILPLEKWVERKAEFKKSPKTINNIMKEWFNDLVFLELQPTQALIFWHYLPHGNCINEESISRLSLNMRIKNLYTPYEEKGLGDYFEPWLSGTMTELLFKVGAEWD